jgi:hypothetical protein
MIKYAAWVDYYMKCNEAGYGSMFLEKPKCEVPWLPKSLKREVELVIGNLYNINKEVSGELAQELEKRMQSKQ